MKQKNYIAGLYLRLSQEDERQGESVSIDNQRMILRNMPRITASRFTANT